jgi:hypothetical protein
MSDISEQSLNLIEKTTNFIYKQLAAEQSLYFRHHQLRIEKELSVVVNPDIRNLILYWSLIDLYKAVKLGLGSQLISASEIEDQPKFISNSFVHIFRQAKSNVKLNDSFTELVVDSLRSLNDINLFCLYFTTYISNCEHIEPVVSKPQENKNPNWFKKFYE